MIQLALDTIILFGSIQQIEEARLGFARVGVDGVVSALTAPAQAGTTYGDRTDSAREPCRMPRAVITIGG